MQPDLFDIENDLLDRMMESTRPEPDPERDTFLPLDLDDDDLPQHPRPRDAVGTIAERYGEICACGIPQSVTTTTSYGHGQRQRERPLRAKSQRIQPHVSDNPHRREAERQWMGTYYRYG